MAKAGGRPAWLAARSGEPDAVFFSLLPALVVAYRYLTRYGFQHVEAAVPFPARARSEAERAAARLNALARGGAD